MRLFVPLGGRILIESDDISCFMDCASISIPAMRDGLSLSIGLVTIGGVGCEYVIIATSVCFDGVLGLEINSLFHF